MNKPFWARSLSVSSLNQKWLSVGRFDRQKGVGLIEVMIGVLIFVGGVMAVTGMQTQAIRTTHDTMQRSQAVWLANAAAELMKLNPGGLDSSTYQTAAATASADLDAYCLVVPATCIGTVCTPAQMADFDIHDLMCRNANDINNNVSGIINPGITINCAAPCNQGDQVTITITWDSRGATAGVLAATQRVNFAYTRN